MTPMHAHHGDEHDRHHERGSDGPSNPHRHKHSAEDFGHSGGRGEQPSWAEAELLKERPRTGQPIPSEPAEELLRSMRRHQSSKHQSNEQQSSRHVISLHIHGIGHR